MLIIASAYTDVVCTCTIGNWAVMCRGSFSSREEREANLCLLVASCYGNKDKFWQCLANQLAILKLFPCKLAWHVTFATNSILYVLISLKACSISWEPCWGTEGLSYHWTHMVCPLRRLRQQKCWWSRGMPGWVTDSLPEESSCLWQTAGNCFREGIVGDEVKVVFEPWSYLWKPEGFF